MVQMLGLFKRPFGQFPLLVSVVRPEYSCGLREIVMMESLNDWKLGNLVQFG